MSKLMETLHEIAFGAEAHTKRFTEAELIERLREHYDDSLRYELLSELTDTRHIQLEGEL